MSSKKNIEWTLEFIKMYEMETLLWNANHPEHNKTSSREKAYEKLVNKMKEVDNNANFDMVKQKLNSLRSQFSRELRLLKSRTTYESDWKYFKALKFIAGKYDQRLVSEAENVSRPIEKSTQAPVVELPQTTPKSLQPVVNDSWNELVQVPSTSAAALKELQQKNRTKAPFVKSAETVLVDTLDKRAKKHNTNYNTIDALARVIAVALRSSNPEQSAVAQNIIQTIVYHAEMKNLNTNLVKKYYK